MNHGDGKGCNAHHDNCAAYRHAVSVAGPVRGVGRAVTDIVVRMPIPNPKPGSVQVRGFSVTDQ